MPKLKLDKDQTFGMVCHSKKVSVDINSSASAEWSAPRNKKYLLLNMGICEKDQFIEGEGAIQVLREMGFVRFDDLIPILGEKKVLSIVKRLDDDI